MGYEMYRLLSSRKGHMADVKVRKKKTSASPMVIDVDEEDKNKELLVGKLAVYWIKSVVTTTAAGRYKM